MALMIEKMNPYDRVICEILKNARRPLTTNEVAYFGNISWLTAGFALLIGKNMNKKSKPGI